MILVDSNVPRYLVGAPHPNKEVALRRIEALIQNEERLVTSAEVLQEILHRYHALARPQAIQPAFDALLGLVDEVFPVELADLEAAKQLLLGGLRGLSARDALHLASMHRRGVSRILSFDAGFDSRPGIARLA